MNLPENIVNALEVSKLKAEHPVSFQLFELVPSGSCEVLIPVSDKMYGNVDLAHEAAARAKKDSPAQHSRFTYLPVVG